MDDLEHVVGALYASALPRLCAYGYLLTGSQSDAEELVQAAIVKVFTRRRRLDGARAAEAYVRAAMRTLRIDEARRASRWRRVMPGQAIATAAADHSETLAQEDEVSRALLSLPPRARVAVALRHYDDLSIEDVAAAMGVTEGTVKSLLHRAREVLGPWLDARDGDGDGETVEVAGEHPHARLHAGRGRSR
ncbi:RNA polymerase sigma factor [Demequina subtropica]|uniref:RNA polymerase sigma factor n=1 Tax=Demequina subtropica TaxID=1638989 RepID=UPI000784A20A|nr:sigma-70 family RNA polymerase sigma factor [Demequina subtropica]